ncbi:hypothetical protein Smp_128230 [Schistosoma mansoni]|uniref:hypothetical protein n=1 Tax=Schistosoma mansoni TaxID=6183 RepID=UPI00022DC013|nr:hypothetical protein Smp_128230 [Schistosoma mansoni]|eukprot:XP_018650471.1 hypothetical protein Smp_128230 [Schistosoma mansoni]
MKMISSYCLIILLNKLYYIEILLNQVYSDSQPYGGAQLKIEWDYDNPASLLENGQICDRVGGKECDVYFTLCLKNAASVADDIDKCHLLQHTTRVFDNAGYLEFREGDSIEIFNEYTFTLGIFEQDIFGSVEVIGTLVANHFSLIPTNNWTNIKMSRENDQYKNIIYVNVRMRLSCVKDYYGNHCQIFCKPEPSRYTCSSDGSYICLPGHKCNERRSACLEEAAKVQRHNNLSTDHYNNSTEVTSVCLNGGTCFDHPIRFEVRCVCLPGWIGARCEIPVEVETPNSNWILITLISVGGILFITVVLLTIGIIWKCFIRKRKVQYLNKHGPIVLYHNPRNSAQSNYGSSCPLNQHFMNITYEDTSNIPPLITKSPNAAYSRQLEPSTIPDEYDECDPLGIYAGTGIYETGFPPDENIEGVDNKDNPLTTTGRISDPFNESAPPLPDRSETYGSPSIQMVYDFNQSINKQRPQSPSNVSTFTNNFNDSTTYRSIMNRDNITNVSVINSPTFENRPKIYRRTSSVCDA